MTATRDGSSSRADRRDWHDDSCSVSHDHVDFKVANIAQIALYYTNVARIIAQKFGQGIHDCIN